MYIATDIYPQKNAYLHLNTYMNKNWTHWEKWSVELDTLSRLIQKINSEAKGDLRAKLQYT